MITVTTNAYQEKMHMEEDEIVLNGPPHRLTGQVNIGNKQDETLFINELPLITGDGLKGLTAGKPSSIKFITALLPGEERNHRINHQLPANTPPGTYEHIMEAGGKKRKVKFIVQQSMMIDLTPLSLYFEGVAPGKSYSAELSLTNNGNMAFAIPDIKHVTTLDEDYLCRATATAMREKGGEGYMAMMDELTKNIYKDMAGWSVVTIKESGQVVPPGKSLQLHFTLTLPKDADPKKDYSGTIRFWNKTISYTIKSQDVNAPKK